MSTEFQNKVYEALKRVPVGRVTTYKHLASAINCKAYQAIGTAMRINPCAPTVPCHRVVKSDGNVGYFKGEKKGRSILEKIALLEKEGIKIKNKKIVGFSKVIYRF